MLLLFNTYECGYRSLVGFIREKKLVIRLKQREEITKANTRASIPNIFLFLQELRADECSGVGNLLSETDEGGASTAASGIKVQRNEYIAVRAAGGSVRSPRS